MWGKDLTADFRSAVRVRDGEFLVGSAGEEEQLLFSMSYDGNTIDPLKVALWKGFIEEVLEPRKAQSSRL